MRNFFYKLVMCVFTLYASFIVFFSYELLLSEIPNTFHMNEGEESTVQMDFPFVMKEDNVCSFMGIIPLKEISVSVSTTEKIYPVGEVVGLYAKTDGIFVIDCCEIETGKGESRNPGKGIVKTGDYILAINNIAIETKEEMLDAVKKSKGQDLKLKIKSGNSIKEKYIRPVKSKNGAYMLGIWVKDDLAGVGTLTYVTEDGQYGALGHGMGNGENDKLLKMKEGDLYKTNVKAIEKGAVGNPGEIEGEIFYGNPNHKGKLKKNTTSGMFGALDQEDLYQFTNGKQYQISYKHEVKKGKAKIISDISGKKESYDIEIEYVDYLSFNERKGLHIKITDPKLLSLTGGIVQGMSGSPIIQDGKIVGAVTHVLINDPKRGYGIFIENMLEAGN